MSAANAGTTSTEYAHIVRTPGTMGGEPRIDGHRIRVRDVVAQRDIEHLSPERIVTEAYPSLTLAEVYAALAYFEDHRDEMRAYEEAEARFVAEFRQQHADHIVDRRPHDE